MELDGELTYVLRDGRGSYVVGDFDGREFRTSWTEPQTITVNPGPAAGPYYAAQSFDNMPDGRIVTMAWQGENRGTTWTGNASFPVEQRLVATADGPRIHSEPVDETHALRRTTRTWGPTQLSPETPLLTDEPAESFDLEAVFDLTGTSAGSFTFHVRAGVDLTYNIAANELNGHPLRPALDGTLALRLLVDRGQLAVFAADGAFYECLNIEPGNDLRLTSDSAVQLTSLALHHLNSIW